MLVIGLTGGIASGKTTVSDLFSSMGVAIIDTDIISRTLLEPGNSGYTEVVKKLGQSILLESDDIDRRKLREQVFSNSKLKVWLESMLHPLIRQAAQQQIQSQSSSPYTILVVPLLFESHFETLVDRVLVIDCPRETQLNRLISRDNINKSLAEKMLDQQMSNQDRVRCADDIIYNDGIKELKPQIVKLHQHYLTLC